MFLCRIVEFLLLLNNKYVQLSLNLQQVLFNCGRNRLSVEAILKKGIPPRAIKMADSSQDQPRLMSFISENQIEDVKKATGGMGTS